MEFNVKRVIAKDYSTACAALFAVVAVEACEYLTTTPDPTQYTGYPSLLIASIAAVGMLTGAISLLKGRGIFDESKTA